MKKRKCYLCNEEFVPKSFNQVVCTKTHYFICPICNKSYVPSKQQIRNFIKFKKVGGCSSKCVAQLGLQTKVKKYGKGNNGDKISETYKNMDINKKQEYVKKVKQTKFKKYGNENYNNVVKNKQTKLKKYGNENYNNREKAVSTRLKNNNGVYRTDEQNRKILQTKLNRYGKGNNGDKISETLSKRTPSEISSFIYKSQKTKLERYGNKNFVNVNKAKQTKLERYGNSNYNNINKIQQTNLKRYGVKNTYQLFYVKEKRKQTNLKRYGVDNIFKDVNKQKQIQQKLIKKYNGMGMGSSIIRQRIENTNLQKYGNKCCFGNKQIRLKIDKTMSKKYNRNYANQLNYSNETYKIINNKDLLIDFIKSIPYTNRNCKYISDKLKISKTSLYVYLRKYQIPTNKILNLNINSFEHSVKQLLDVYNINYIQHYRNIISPYELDFYIPERNLAIECNGNYWHSESILQDKNYHYNKSKLCEEKGIRLIHIFEYEWDNERQRPILENIIKSALGINKTIYARKLDIIVKESREMREFFDKNNIQGFRGGKFAICLVDKVTKEIYMSYLFGNAFFGKGKYEYEVIRGATKLRL